MNVYARERREKKERQRTREEPPLNPKLCKGRERSEDLREIGK